MSFFSRKREGDGICPGDVFHKIGTYGANWVVERLFDYPDIPRHARLVDSGSGRTMTVAVSMLQDPDVFKPVKP